MIRTAIVEQDQITVGQDVRQVLAHPTLGPAPALLVLLAYAVANMGILIIDIFLLS